MEQVEFICLANSKKHGKRCVAGARLDTGEWIRPISEEKHGELSPSDVRLSSGGTPQKFDVISAILDKHLPVKNQPENWSVRNSPWRLVCRPLPKHYATLLKKMLFRGSILFGNTLDKVAYHEFETTPAKESLLLAKPVHPRWVVRRNPRKYWEKQLRVNFRLGSVPYDLAVTDISSKEMLKGRPLGKYSSAQLGIHDETALYFTISLGEPYDGYCFKLVAAVLQLPNGWPSLE